MSESYRKAVGGRLKIGGKEVDEQEDAKSSMTNDFAHKNNRSNIPILFNNTRFK